jgi:hypothetical protein
MEYTTAIESPKSHSLIASSIVYTIESDFNSDMSL